MLGGGTPLAIACIILAMAERVVLPPLYVVDVDLTIVDSFNDFPLLIPGRRQMLKAMSTLGEVVLWSAGGADYVQDTVATFGLHNYVHGWRRKPEYPPQEDEALSILGRKPDLQVDDDPSERVADWPFLHLPFTFV